MGIKDNAAILAIILDGDDIGIGDDHNTKFRSKIISDNSACFGIFTREKATVSLHNEDFSTKLGVVFGDFAAGGTATNDEGKFWQAT